ncbi:glycosyltransferase [uncultured Rummeliibacillus sp.]|uniref:glycosyltransferase n=1 Tax=uncultured Rummeliibacillus sp. TaxID=762292 RepID=UPI00262B9F26|nr:glycosyltransferase [uncultured Rummeliibacillus sp.]
MKKKVLYLIYQLVGGGAEKILVDIVNHMDELLYDITVMTIVDCSRDAHVLNSNIKYKYIFNGKYKEDRLFFKFFNNAQPHFLHEKLIREKYDIEIAALEGIPAKIISGCKSSSTKKIAIIHADASNIAWPKKRYKNFNQEYESYNNFDKLIFVSNNTLNRFIEKFNIDLEKTVVMYNPFDIKNIKKKSKESLNDFHRKQDILFCAIGRLEKVKGFDRLIEAFNVIQKKYKDIELLIIGEGDEKNKLAKMIANYDLTNRITLLGYRTNPYKYLKNSDCYICSSRSEGLSTTVIESMILDVPIISTDCGGMDDLLNSYSKSIICANNIEGLVRGLEEFLYFTETDLLNKEFIKVNLDKFSFRNYFEKFIKIIE